MKRSTFAWMGGAVGFASLLLYATLRTAPAPPTERAREAETLCLRSVSERLTGARFPFPANVTDLGNARYRLRGTVDAGQEDGRVRRNYECVIRHTGPGTYRADSVRIWQSH